MPFAPSGCFTPTMEVDTRSVPANERYDFWHASVCDRFVPLLATPSTRDLQGRIRSVEVAEARVRRIAGTEHRFQRRPQDISHGDAPELLNLVFLNRGTTIVEQDGRVATLRAGDFVFYDSSRPFDFRTRGDFDYTILLLPRDLLGQSERVLRSCTVRPRSSAHGVAGMTRRLLSSLVTPGRPVLGPTHARAIQDTLVDTVAPLLPSMEPTASAETLLLLARAHIQRNLADPDLSPGSVAAACEISVSYLHRLFDDQPSTVAAYIREERLRVAAQMLVSPLHRNASIATIGSACGIVDAAHFSRMIRRRFGVPPRELRRGLPADQP